MENGIPLNYETLQVEEFLFSIGKTVDRFVLPEYEISKV